MKKTKNFLSEFILKLVGYITMTFDHIGVFFEMTNLNPNVAEIFRCIGKIAFPLFVFGIVEGIIHTRNVKNYLIRLAILAGVVVGGEVIIQYGLGMQLDIACPLTDLVFIALAIYLLNRKDKFSFLSILPMGYIILSFVLDTIEFNTSKNFVFLPKLFRCDYTIFGLLLALGFYYAKDVAKLILKSNKETENLEETEYLQLCQNILSVFVAIFVPLIFSIIQRNSDVYFTNTIIEFAAVSAIPLFFYSGKRGYNAKWFNIFSYLYFPAHIVIIFLIFVLTGAFL